MDASKIKSFVEVIKDHLNINGIAIMRRLNGDYELQNIVSGYLCVDKLLLHDKSEFYKELVIGINI
jgi:hypothetical protein